MSEIIETGRLYQSAFYFAGDGGDDPIRLQICHNTLMPLSIDAQANSMTPAAGHALVLLGGGARTAYQVGVLRAMAQIMKWPQQTLRGRERAFPFKILVGTSAGALNVSFLASVAEQGWQAFDSLAQFWADIRSADVYSIQASTWLPSNRLTAAYNLSKNARAYGAVLNNIALVNTLHHAISLPGIEAALANRTLQALAVTASSYTSGVHWTFCQTAPDNVGVPWTRLGRRADFQPITIEHLMASSAIPFIFPATPLWVDGHREYFGDGSMRQISPLAPAIHLGADKVLVIGVGQPERAMMGAEAHQAQKPSFGAIAGHAMASVFHDTLQADVEQVNRISNMVTQLPSSVAQQLPFRPVQILAIHPTQSLDDLARTFAHELPTGTQDALHGLGGLSRHESSTGAALASYLLFEPGFVRALLALGEHDAYARSEELVSFFKDPTA